MGEVKVNLDNLRVFASVISTAISSEYGNIEEAAYRWGQGFSTRTKKQKHELAKSIADLVTPFGTDTEGHSMKLMYRLSLIFINVLSTGNRRDGFDAAIKAVEDEVIKLVLD